MDVISPARPGAGRSAGKSGASFTPVVSKRAVATLLCYAYASTPGFEWGFLSLHKIRTAIRTVPRCARNLPPDNRAPAGAARPWRAVN